MKTMIPISQEDIKLQNRRRIIAHLRERREATKQEIAAATGISIPTVAANIAELLDEGLLEEAGTRRSTGGRKPLALRFLPAGRLSLGIDLEPKGGRIIAVDLDHSLIAEKRFALPKEQEKLLPLLKSEILAFLDEQNFARERVDGIGVAAAGTVNPELQVLEVAPNLGYRYIDFRLLEEELTIPVRIYNEANASAWAEWLREGLGSPGTMIYISITEGVGGGIIIDGRLFLGSAALAGEMGHMVTVPSGRLCNCGQKGCWERYVSETSLLTGGPRRFDSLEAFFADLSGGDPQVVERWEAYIDHLAQGIRNLIVLFDPNSLVVGGAIANYASVMIPSLLGAIDKGGSSIMDRGVSVRASRLAQDASIIGAGLLAFTDRYS